MRRFRVTWSVEVEAVTPRFAAEVAWAHFVDVVEDPKSSYANLPPLTVVGLDDQHTTEFAPSAAEALR